MRFIVNTSAIGRDAIALGWIEVAGKRVGNFSVVGDDVEKFAALLSAGDVECQIIRSGRSRPIKVRRAVVRTRRSSQKNGS